MFFIRHIKKPKRLAASAASLAILLAAIFMPAAALASTYGSGPYGSCTYGNGCAATSTSNGSSGNTVTTTSGSQILLNDFSDYTTSTGVQLELKTGQVVYFNVTNSDGSSQQYTVTIKEVGADFLVVN